jgi:hypothetical protein
VLSQPIRERWLILGKKLLLRLNLAAEKELLTLTETAEIFTIGAMKARVEHKFVVN